MRVTYGAVAVLVVVAVLSATRPQAAEDTEILWDRYGVPHIYAADRESMFYAHGWSQMRNQADLLLRLYGESRGRAAEYWGGDANLELDRWTHLNGVPERARSWYDAQDPTFRKYLDEFARGINDFAAKNPYAISQEYRDRSAGDRPRRRSASSSCRSLRLHGIAGADDEPRSTRCCGPSGQMAKGRWQTRSSRQDQIHGRSVQHVPRAGTPCSSSIPIWRGATRSIGTCRSIWSARTTTRSAPRRSGFPSRSLASTATRVGAARSTPSIRSTSTG